MLVIYDQTFNRCLQNKKKPLNIQGFQPADDGTRTRDLLTTNEVRYHLCHISVLCFSSSSEPHI